MPDDAAPVGFAANGQPGDDAKIDDLALGNPRQILEPGTVRRNRGVGYVTTIVVCDDKLLRDQTVRALESTGRVKVVSSVGAPVQAAAGSRAPVDVILVCLKDGQIPVVDAPLTLRTPPHWLVSAQRASAALALACVDLQLSSVAPLRSLEQMVAAVELCAQGIRFHSADLVRLLPRRLGPDAWTSTEIEMLLLLREGLPLKQISARLNYSGGAVRNMCSRLYRRLGARNRFQAVSEACRKGLL